MKAASSIPLEITVETINVVCKSKKYFNMSRAGIRSTVSKMLALDILKYFLVRGPWFSIRGASDRLSTSATVWSMSVEFKSKGKVQNKERYIKHDKKQSN